MGAWEDYIQNRASLEAVPASQIPKEESPGYAHPLSRLVPNVGMDPGGAHPMSVPTPTVAFPGLKTAVTEAQRGATGGWDEPATKVTVAPEAQTPRPAPDYGLRPGSSPKVDYSGADVAPAPQGLPPGVTKLRMDVPADGPKFALGGGINGAEMPSVVNPTARAPGAWGNASGQGPVTAVIGNGITREMENRLRHFGGEGAVLAMNQAADMGPLQKNALAANTEKTQAETNKILQDPGFEGRRVGVLEQEAQNRLALGQGELGMKGADIAMRERLGMGQLGQEQQKINILGTESKVKIAGMELDQKKQREFSDMASALAMATDPVQQETLRSNMLAFLGVKDNKDLDIKAFPPTKVTDNVGNTTVSPGYVIVTGKDGKPNIFPLGGHEPAVAPPKEAIAYLKKNPGTAADFEAKFRLPPGGHKQYLQ